MSLNGNHCIESIFRYRWYDHQWQDCAIFTTWFNSGFRNRSPWHFAAVNRSYIRLQRRNTTVATIACRRSNAVCPFESQHIAFSSCYLWSALRARTWAFVIHSLHGRHVTFIMQSFGLKHHSVHTYADHNEIYSSCLSVEYASLKIKVIDCIDNVDKWMASNDPIN